MLASVLRRVLVAVVGLATALHLAPPSAAGDLALSSDEEAAFYRWWDARGFPDVAKAPFVKVARGEWYQRRGARKTPVYDYAFLVGDAGATFEVFTTDLQRPVLRKTPAGTAEPERVGYEPAELVAFVRAGVEVMRARAEPVAWHDDDALDPFRARRYLLPNHAFRLLVLARACAARGAPDLASALCTLALRARWADDDDRPRDAADVLKLLQADVAAEARRGADLRLGAAEVPLPQVRDELLRLAEAFPEDRSFADDAATVARMLTDAARDAPAPSAGGTPGAARDAELEALVVRLREIEGGVVPGDLRTAPAGAPPTPAQRLVALGFVACPRLIAALSDRSFTRATLVFTSGRGQYRDRVRPYRVRDAAIDVLDRIAAGGFRGEDGAWALHPNTTDAWAALVARVTRWWDEASTLGEEAVLVASVRAGGRPAIAPALRLAEAYPGSALAALRVALAVTEEGWAAGQLVGVVGQVPGAAAADLLLEVLREDRRPRARLTAAQGLLRRGRLEGVTAMTQEWAHPSAREAGPRPFLPADPAFDRDLLAFLASSGSADAYRALAQGLGDQPVGRRFHVLSAFLRAGTSSTFAVGSELHVGGAAEGGPSRLDAEARRALEDLLGARLGDDTDPMNVWMSVDGTEVDTRLGHVAARALAALDPVAYPYDPTAPPEVRETQRRAAQARWRAARGLPPVPPTAPRPTPAVVAADVVGPAVDRYLASADDAARAAAGAALDALGLGALPHLLARRKALAADDPAAARLDEVAAGLASVVTEAVVAADSAPADDAFRASLDGPRGRKFDRGAFLRLVLGVTRGPVGGPAGLRLRVVRDGDLTGVRVVATLVKDPLHGGGGDEEGWSQWSYAGPDIRVDGDGGRTTAGAMAIEHGRKEDTWADEAQALEAALRSPPTEAVVVTFSVVREE